MPRHAANRPPRSVAISSLTTRSPILGIKLAYRGIIYSSKIPSLVFFISHENDLPPVYETRSRDPYPRPPLTESISIHRYFLISFPRAASDTRKRLRARTLITWERNRGPMFDGARWVFSKVDAFSITRETAAYPCFLELPVTPFARYRRCVVARRNSAFPSPSLFS